MPQTVPGVAVRRMSYVGMAFAALNLSFAMLATREGSALRWIAIAGSILMMANSFVGLQIGPIRSVRAQLWFAWASVVVAIGLNVGLVFTFIHQLH